MRWSRIARILPVILGCSGAFAGGVYASGSSPSQATVAGLFIASASTGILAVLLAIHHVGRATRRSIEHRSAADPPGGGPPIFSAKR
jgi:xanthine/uracil permease